MNKLHNRNKTLPDTFYHQPTLSDKLTHKNTSFSNSTINLSRTLHVSEKVHINDYINIMKTTNTSKWTSKNKQNSLWPWISEDKKTDIEKNNNQRMSQIVAKRRKMKFSYEHKDGDLMRKHGMCDLVEAIVGCYEYYLKFGFSTNKITSIKKELEWIFLKKVRKQLNVSEYGVQYRAKTADILNKLLRTVIAKVGHHKLLIIRDVTTFKTRLQEDIVNKGKTKITQIKDSIKNQKKQIDSRIQSLAKDRRFKRFSRTYYRSLAQNELNVVIDVDQLQICKSQSRVNRLMYKQLTMTSQFN